MTLVNLVECVTTIIYLLSTYILSIIWSALDETTQSHNIYKVVIVMIIIIIPIFQMDRLGYREVI